MVVASTMAASVAPNTDLLGMAHTGQPTVTFIVFSCI